jgi:signal transduction histidine kinase
MAEIQKIEEEEDIDFISSDINSLIGDTLDGTLRVKDIVKGLQEFSHINGDTKSPCDLIRCLDTTLKIVKNDLKDCCTVVTEFETTSMVLGNQGEISQVLLNLIVNAGQAVCSEGKITIATLYSDGMVQMSIKDNGTGIDQKNINRIFDPFFTTKDVGVGTGLGLSISYGIIQDHGGTITVESEVGKGSTFTISLPAIEEPELQQAA